LACHNQSREDGDAIWFARKKVQIAEGSTFLFAKNFTKVCKRSGLLTTQDGKQCLKVEKQTGQERDESSAGQVAMQISLEHVPRGQQTGIWQGG